MKISDLLIIYFSGGAPVAVYFYLQNRAALTNRKKIWRETVFTFLFWIPAAARFLSNLELFENNIVFNRPNETSPRIECEEKLFVLQKRLEKISQTRGGKISVFEFRETLERYAGLTLASRIRSGKQNEEFFTAARNKNSALAAKCFERRNRLRLCFHQTSARRDFLQALAQISDAVSDRRELAALAVAFAENLEDFEAAQAVGKMFAAAPPNDEQMRGEILENDLWKPETQLRPQTARR